MPTTPPPKRRKNTDVRPHEFLTPDEVQRMLDAVKKSSGRNKDRDTLIIMMLFLHGLRVSELIHLQWSQVNFHDAQLSVIRLKAGKQSIHPLLRKEITLLKQIRTQHPDQASIFISERLSPLSAASVRKMVQLIGKEAGLGPRIHPHMLRHATGYKLANDGVDTRTIQDYLGHKNIQHTVKYTEISPSRFKGLFSGF